VGPTVVLRRHQPANLDAFRRWYGSPEIARLTRYRDGPMLPDEIDRFFTARVLGIDSLTLAVHVKATDQLIGSCAFSQLDGDNGSALFHITIGEKDQWGHGYGTEATELMLRHAFQGLGLHRVSLAVFSFNERAIRSYRKVGFTVEGRAREAIFRDGRFWDEITMSILEPEWRTLHAPARSPRSAAKAAATTGPVDAPGTGDAPGPSGPSGPSSSAPSSSASSGSASSGSASSGAAGSSPAGL
jgi:RimJ/RimL family protein N-acetyltransferase